MAFRFVHTADWHIGKAFGSFEPDKAALLRDARYSAVENITTVARENAVGHVLVAGDVFDSPGLPDSVLRKLCSTRLHGVIMQCSYPTVPQPKGTIGCFLRTG